MSSAGFVAGLAFVAMVVGVWIGKGYSDSEWRAAITAHKAAEFQADPRTGKTSLVWLLPLDAEAKTPAK